MSLLVPRDEPPSTFTDRYEAASKLHPLAERAARVCAKADPDGLHGQGHGLHGQPLEPFALPPPEELKQRQLQRQLERQQQLRHMGSGQGEEQQQQHGQGHEKEGEEYGEYDEGEQGKGEGEDGYKGEGEEGDYLEEGGGCEEGAQEEGEGEDGSMGTRLASDGGRPRGQVEPTGSLLRSEHGEVVEVDSGRALEQGRQGQGGRVAVGAHPEMSPERQQQQREEQEVRWRQEQELEPWRQWQVAGEQKRLPTALVQVDSRLHPVF